MVEKTEKKEEDKTKKTNSKKETKVKEVKKQTKVKKVEEVKKTILQLINESSVRQSIIIGALNYADLIDKFNTEKSDKEMGLYIEPSMTDSEFNEIINKFINRRI